MRGLESEKRRESQFNTTSMWAMGAPPGRSHISQLGGSGRHSGQDPDAWALAHPPPRPMHRSNAQGPTVTTDRSSSVSPLGSGGDNSSFPETGRRQRKTVQLTR